MALTYRSAVVFASAHSSAPSTPLFKRQTRLRFDGKAEAPAMAGFRASTASGLSILGGTGKPEVTSRGSTFKVRAESIRLETATTTESKMEEDRVMETQSVRTLAPRPLGVTLRPDGSARAAVWAPNAMTVELETSIEDLRTFTTVPVPQEVLDNLQEWESAPEPEVLSDYQPLETSFALQRVQDGSGNWEVELPAGVLCEGTPYRFALNAEATIFRRDPYARASDYDSKWCYADDGGVEFQWEDWQPRPFDENVIYEMHVGSFTPEGTLEAAVEKLKHIADAGFTAIELMPLAEFSYATERWGYNPRQLLSIHGPYGKPQDLRRFVNEAHILGIGVIVDVVLHHGAVDGNELWDFDGWGGNYFGEGGIYHE
ncbi:hypothetical protein CYMTET_42926, partial [Cymbomonas tetramitiformis]